MNKQQKGSKFGIEYLDFTHNIGGGCFHECQWKMPTGETAICYAKGTAEKVAGQFYPNGFEHHYWHPERLLEPARHKEPARIGLFSMWDMFGHWIPDEQIEQIFEMCRTANWHEYLILTKNPGRLLKFIGRFPTNVWIGVSMPPSSMNGHALTVGQQSMFVHKALSVLDSIRWEQPENELWMSFEPLSFDVAKVLNEWSEATSLPTPLTWSVIGAASSGSRYFQPEHAWTADLISLLDSEGAGVFFKGNLEWPTRREDMPARWTRKFNQFPF